MMKIVASLVILGLCANVAFGAAVTSSSNSGAFSTSVLNNSFVTQILKGTNATDSANWDSSCATCGSGSSAVDAGVYNDYTWFGPGATNDTSYLWGVPSTGSTSASTTGKGSVGAAGSGTVYTTSSIRKRTVNNTIVGWGNDTVQACVLGDTAITTSITGSSIKAAVGPGYLAVLSSGLDTVATPNYQVWITLVGGVSGSASSTVLTKTSDIFANTAGTSPTTTQACTTTTVGLGNVWYDIGASAFFYTYYTKVVTTTVGGTAGTCGGSTASTTSNIYLGGLYLNGTAYWTTPITVSAATAGNTISSLMAGGDNWLNSTNIYVVYKDSTAAITYWSKTAKASTTSALGTFSSLIADPATTTGPPAVAVSYSPISVWASNWTYAVTVSVTTVSTPSTGSATTTYTYTNFLNGSSTGVDSGLAGTTTSTPAGYFGWQLNTGYTILSAYASTTSPYPVTYTLSTFYANGTANGTAVTLGSLSYTAAQVYEDVNGTMWVGWTDEDYGNSDYTYNAYLAKLQGQLNAPSGATVLSAISFFALFLAAIFVF